VYADEPRASKLISSLLGHRLLLENQPRVDEKTGIDRRTVFGDVPVSEMKPDWTPETMPDYFQLKTGTFFEIGAVYLLGSGSVGHLRELQGGTALIDRRRFRPNIYVDTGPATDRFVEDEWIGGTLEVGGSVVLEEFQPTSWCVTSTLAQEELPRDRCCARPRSITRVASGSTPRSGSQVSSVSVIKSSSTVQEWPKCPVGFPVGLEGVGGTDADPAVNSLPDVCALK
jgi:MOSC domain